jgi:hypothetical protein
VVRFSRVSAALSGVVYELDGVGRTPLADVTVYCDACGEVGHTWLRTDVNGHYRFSGDLAAGGGIGLAGPTTQIWVGRDGYGDPPSFPGGGWRTVTIDGDTQFDVELVRN